MTQETLEERVSNFFVNNKNLTSLEIAEIGAKWQQEQYTIEEQHVGHTIDELDKQYIKGFNEGSAYQQERSYSEEDMRKAIQETITLMRYRASEFREHENTVIEQFKNK